MTQTFYFEFIDARGRTIDGRLEDCSLTRAKGRAMELLNKHRQATSVVGYRERGLSIVTASKPGATL